jgi:integrase
MASIRDKKLKNGATSYEVRINRKGHPTLSESFSGPDAHKRAVEWAKLTEAKIIESGSPIPKKPTASIEAICAEFIAEAPPPSAAARSKARAKATLKGSPAAGKAAPSPKKQVLTLKLAADGSVSDGLVATHLNDGERQQVEAVARHLGSFTVETLNRRKIEKWMELLAETPIPPPAHKAKDHPLYKGSTPRYYAESTIRKFFYQLKKVMEWHARAHRYRLDADLFECDNIPGSWEGQRERRLEGDEEQRILAAIETGMKYKDGSHVAKTEAWRRIFPFAIETAMRAQEIIMARWEHLDFEQRSLYVPPDHVKTTKGRDVPLSTRSIAALRKMKEIAKEGEPRIFWQWTSTSDLGKGFRRIACRAGIPIGSLTLHDLRHEGTSRLFENTDLKDVEIMAITGHTSYETIKGYLKLRKGNIADRLG